MLQGQLRFSKNGECWGVAFSDPELKKGVFYPAVAPIYLGDGFSLIQPMAED